MKTNGFEAVDSELIAIIRRIEDNGNGKIEFFEFNNFFEPAEIKMKDVKIHSNQEFMNVPAQYN